MRTESEMYQLILDFAKADERVRAVLQNGSRSNPNAPKDVYQDFDIAFLVTETESFTRDHSWIDCFGKRLMLQMPEAMRPLGDSADDGSFGYLMLFEDGNRIDLSLVPITENTLRQFDGLTKCLLDKDGIVPAYPPPDDSAYWVLPPSRLYYDSCCNNFFWCLQNVAKGIARDELPYAMEMYNHWVRNELSDMIAWYIGIKTEFHVSAGKMGKYFKNYLPAHLYQMYAQTYSDADYEHFWKAISTACALFRLLAREVADVFQFSYCEQDDDGMLRYLKMVREHVLEDTEQ